jgi:hypothetical protein
MAKQSVYRPRPLPAPRGEYDQKDEALARRSSEINFNALSEQARDGKEHRSKESSLALRRHSFLLMGAG